MTLGQDIGRLHRAALRRITRLVAEDSERTFHELRALRAIDHEEIRTQTGLSERLLMDAAAVSRLVDRLESLGLLERHEGNDRRSVRLAVTPAGKRQIKHLERALDVFQDEARRHLSHAEVEQLSHLMMKLAAGLSLRGEEPQEQGAGVKRAGTGRSK